MASKAIKYYAGLAVGKNNACLLKEVRLLRAYIDILKSFKIVGSQTICNCCIEGDYTFYQNIDVDSFSNIQFSCNNTGLFYSNENSFTFEWNYLDGNLMIKLENDDIINYTGVSFSEECNIEYTEQSGSFIVQAPVTITNVAMFGGGSLTQQFLVNNSEIYIHNGVYIDYTEFINDFNTNNTFGYTIEYISGDDIIVYGPFGSNTFEINYFNPIYENDGGNFSNISSIDSGFFINDNPCTPETVEQTCLSNNQIIKIINKITKMCK
jgi:hypothetical protein